MNVQIQLRVFSKPSRVLFIIIAYMGKECMCSWYGTTLFGLSDCGLSDLVLMLSIAVVLDEQKMWCLVSFSI